MIGVALCTAASTARVPHACGAQQQQQLAPGSLRSKMPRTQAPYAQGQAACRRRGVVVLAAADSGAAMPGVPPAWDLAQRVSADAMAVLAEGDTYAAELILKKGIQQIREEHPKDPSTALLHTQLWNILMDNAQYAGAIEEAEGAYDLMISHFGEDSADAAFHGIRLGISLAVGGGDIDRAQQLLVYGGSCAQHNLELFWNKVQEMEAAGEDSTDMQLHTRKLMVALAECNFYGAIGIVRKAIQTAEELELPMSDLQEAWLGGTKQMAMALPPDHPLFTIALRELGRLVPEAAGRPTIQSELETVMQGLKDLLNFIKEMPDTLKEGTAMAAAAQQQPAEAPRPEDEYLP